MDTKNREEGIYLANAATKLEKGEQVLCPECGGKLAVEFVKTSYTVYCTNEKCDVETTIRGI